MLVCILHWFWLQTQKAVQDARISINLDAPEGSLDALMQVVVCQQIGNQKHTLFTCFANLPLS